MRIGELAKQAGLAASALRYYEQVGLLPDVERTTGGSRRYSEASLLRLKMIKGLQSMGFALEDMQIFFAHDKCEADQAQILAAIDTRLGELDDLVENLQSNRAALTNVRNTLVEIKEQSGCPDEATLRKLAGFVTGEGDLPAEFVKAVQ